MSRALDRFHQLLDDAKNELGKVFGRGHRAAEEAAEKLDQVKADLEADAPELEAEAVQDAETVAHDAGHAASPVVEVAEQAGERIADETAHDIATAANTNSTEPPAPPRRSGASASDEPVA